MNLTQCPYDGAQVETSATSDASFTLTCAACGAAWERTNGRTRRVQEPDPERLRSARGLGPGPRLGAVEPLPMTADVDLRATTNG